MLKDPEQSKHGSSNKTIQECSFFYLQDRLNDTVVGPEQQELHLDEDFYLSPPNESTVGAGAVRNLPSDTSP